MGVLSVFKKKKKKKTDVSSKKSTDEATEVKMKQKKKQKGKDAVVVYDEELHSSMSTLEKLRLMGDSYSSLGSTVSVESVVKETKTETRMGNDWLSHGCPNQALKKYKNVLELQQHLVWDDELDEYSTEIEETYILVSKALMSMRDYEGAKKYHTKALEIRAARLKEQYQKTKKTQLKQQKRRPSSHTNTTPDDNTTTSKRFAEAKV